MFIRVLPGSQTITITTTTTVKIEPASQDHWPKPKKRPPIPISSDESNTAPACLPSPPPPLPPHSPPSPSSSKPISKMPSSPSSASISIVDWDVFYASRYGIKFPTPKDLAQREFLSDDYYAVTVGKEVGIFLLWNQVGPLTLGFSAAVQKRYPTYKQALHTYLGAYHNGELAIVDKGGDIAKYKDLAAAAHRINQ
ncbi:hypothetical protein AAF712_016462 [Marasmius tenuissimus]|uniref:Ribonuclease H1 N-terminal domain-containing protein n=1 Tax=Marasmius tenuissimus TaxID=585030 RepID=A0ABR2Z5W2_9AGAR